MVVDHDGGRRKIVTDFVKKERDFNLVRRYTGKARTILLETKRPGEKRGTRKGPIVRGVGTTAGKGKVQHYWSGLQLAWGSKESMRLPNQEMHTLPE